LAVAAKKALRAAEQDQLVAAKQAAAVLQAHRDAEARRLASLERVAQAPQMLLAAAEERHRNFAVTLTLAAKNLEKRMLIIKPHAFVKIFRRVKAVPTTTSASASAAWANSPDGAAAAASDAASSLGSIAAAATATSPLASASALSAAAALSSAAAGSHAGGDIWEFHPSYQCAPLKSTSDPAWPPLGPLSLESLIGADRRAPFRIEVWNCVQVERVLGPRPEEPNAILPPGGIVPSSGVEVELLGVATLTLAQLETAAQAQGKVGPNGLPPPGPSPLILTAPLSVQFTPFSLELPLTHPKKGNRKQGSLFVQAIHMEEL
jgi:hypothetical protein